VLPQREAPDCAQLVLRKSRPAGAGLYGGYSRPLVDAWEDE
jgi:hypothetical protein